MRSIFRLVLLVCVLTSLTGCGGKKNFLNENDRLRKENLDLKRQVEALQKD